MLGLTTGSTAYSPQLGARLGISHTQLNIVALSGNSTSKYYSTYLCLMSLQLEYTPVDRYGAG